MSDKNTTENNEFYGAEQVTMSEALDILVESHYTKGLTPFIIGDAGIGKTALAYQAAEMLRTLTGHQYDTGLLEMGTCEPYDIKGSMYLVDRVLDDTGVEIKTTEFAVPDVLPRAGHGVFLGDEFSNASLETQRAFMNFALTRKIGSYELPPGWMMYLAANVGSAYDVTELTSPALISRFMFLKIKVDYNVWLEWYKKDDSYNGMVADYISNKPGAIYDHDGAKAARAFANPRGWVKVGNILNSAIGRGMDINTNPMYHKMFTGIIGPSNATNFLGFLETRKDIIELDRVLLNFLSVKAQFNRVKTSSNMGIISELTKAVAMAVMSRGSDAAEMDRMVPNICEFILNLTDELILVFAQELKEAGAEYKGVLQSFQHKVLACDPTVADRLINIVRKLDKVD